ncbi:pentapeptide repeat-containing protein [Marinobacterium aestuariivivens]|uniref:Pentapeptide repeat-containing protein n=1 Tax=Marinobacterium aestuariivivens TaxID=1698799 RepID=A0ABW2A0D4_9GAMM
MLTPPGHGGLIRNIGLTLAAYLGAPFVIWRLKIASDQAITAENRVIANRFAKAADQLYSVRRITHKSPDDSSIQIEEEQPNFEVRIGGLYALKHILEDSKRYQIQVCTALCAYIRFNSLRELSADCNKNDELTCKKWFIDVQTALEIIGYISQEQRAYERDNCFCLNLSGANLQWKDLKGMNFQAVDFENADFRNAKLEKSDLTHAFLGGCKFEGAVLDKCKFDRASLRDADLSKAKGLDLESLKRAHGVKIGYGKTKLPDKLLPPENWFKAEDSYEDPVAFREAYRAHFLKTYEKDPEFKRFSEPFNKRNL